MSSNEDDDVNGVGSQQKSSSQSQSAEIDTNSFLRMDMDDFHLESGGFHSMTDDATHFPSILGNYGGVFDTAPTDVGGNHEMTESFALSSLGSAGDAPFATSQSTSVMQTNAFDVDAKQTPKEDPSQEQQTQDSAVVSGEKEKSLKRKAHASSSGTVSMRKCLRAHEQRGQTCLRRVALCGANSLVVRSPASLVYSCRVVASRIAHTSASQSSC